MVLISRIYIILLSYVPSTPPRAERVIYIHRFLCFATYSAITQISSLAATRFEVLQKMSKNQHLTATANKVLTKVRRDIMKTESLLNYTPEVGISLIVYTKRCLTLGNYLFMTSSSKISHSKISGFRCGWKAFITIWTYLSRTKIRYRSHYSRKEN